MERSKLNEDSPESIPAAHAARKFIERKIAWWKSYKLVRRMATSIKSFPICGVLVQCAICMALEHILQRQISIIFDGGKSSGEMDEHFPRDPSDGSISSEKSWSIFHIFAKCQLLRCDIQTERRTKDTANEDAKGAMNNEHCACDCKCEHLQQQTFPHEIPKDQAKRCSSQTYQRKMRDAVWLAPIATASVRFKCEMIAAFVHSCG